MTQYNGDAQTQQETRNKIEESDFVRIFKQKAVDIHGTLVGTDSPIISTSLGCKQQTLGMVRLRLVELIGNLVRINSLDIQNTVKEHKII